MHITIRISKHHVIFCIVLRTFKGLTIINGLFLKVLFNRQLPKCPSYPDSRISIPEFNEAFLCISCFSLGFFCRCGEKNREARSVKQLLIRISDGSYSVVVGFSAFASPGGQTGTYPPLLAPMRTKRYMHAASSRKHPETTAGLQICAGRFS